MKPNKKAGAGLGKSQHASRTHSAMGITSQRVLCLCMLCLGSASAWAQSGEIIILRELSPRIATKPAESVQQGGPVRASVFAGREDLIAAGMADLVRSNEAGKGLGAVADATSGEAVSRPITQTINNTLVGHATGTALDSNMPGASLVGQLPSASFAQPLLSLTQSLGGGIASSAAGGGQSVGSQVQQGTAGLTNSILGGVMP
jgi:hypothetical protein